MLCGTTIAYVLRLSLPIHRDIMFCKAACKVCQFLFMAQQPQLQQPTVTVKCLELYNLHLRESQPFPPKDTKVDKSQYYDSSQLSVYQMIQVWHEAICYLPSAEEASRPCPPLLELSNIKNEEQRKNLS